MSTTIHPGFPSNPTFYQPSSAQAVANPLPSSVSTTATASASASADAPSQAIETPPPSPVLSASASASASTSPSAPSASVLAQTSVPCYLWIHRPRTRDTLYLYESIQDAYASVLSRHTRIHDDPGDIVWDTTLDNILTDIAADSFTHTDRRTTNLDERVWGVSFSQNLQLSIGLGTDLPRGQSALFCSHGYETIDTNPEYADMPSLLSFDTYNTAGLITLTPARTNVSPVNADADADADAEAEAEADEDNLPPLVPLYSLNNTHIPLFRHTQGLSTQGLSINGLD